MTTEDMSLMKKSVSPRHKYADALMMAQDIGSWAAYSTYMQGNFDTGDQELDKLLTTLMDANEKVHLRANQLSLMYDLPLFSAHAQEKRD